MNNKGDSIVICPIYPMDFSKAKLLYMNTLRLRIPLCFVFTFASDFKLFVNEFCYRSKPNFLSLILEHDFTIEQIKKINENKSFPTIKKLYALNQLKGRFHHYLTVDAELVIFENNISDLAEFVWFRRKWFGGQLNADMTGEREILYRSSHEIVPKGDHELLASLTNNFTVYSWWWDIPVYFDSHLEDFFKWINWDDLDFIVDNLTWSSFDHLIYQYYTVIFGGFELVSVPNVIHSLEFANYEIYSDLRENGNKVTWANSAAYFQFPNSVVFNRIFGVFHIDRSDIPDYNLKFDYQRKNHFRYVFKISQNVLRKLLNNRNCA